MIKYFLYLLLLCSLLPEQGVLAQAAFFDPTFGIGGKVTVTPGPGASDFGRFTSVALQTDGKIVAAGQFEGQARAMRLNADGSTDLSFHIAGHFDLAEYMSKFLDVKIQPDGKILLAGEYYSGIVGAGNYDFIAIRLDANGWPDMTFGVGGKMIIDRSGFADYCTSLALQTDGKIVLAGYINSLNSGIIRLHANGQRDSTFGINGWVIGAYGSADQVDVAPDGKIVLAGHSSAAHGYQLMALRHLSNGSLDTSFNHTGIVYTLAGDPGGNFGRGMKVQPDGKIIVAGSGGFGSEGGNFVAVRYNVDGTLDNTFGIGGISDVDFESELEDALEIGLKADGSMVLTGVTCPNDSCQVAIACLNANGTLNTAWGSSGKIVTYWGERTDYGRAAVLQPDGKIIVVGEMLKNDAANTYYPCVARYTPYPAGVSEHELAEDVHVYPNPTKGQFYVGGMKQEHIKSITVYDVFGRRVSTTCGDNHVVSIKEAAKGFYIVSVESIDGKQVVCNLLLE